MLDNKIKLIQANILAAQEHLLEIEAAMHLLEQKGMYPAVPHFQWQNRGGDGQYLYCIFRQNGNGDYTGPGGKRKLYIGANEANIKEAKRLTRNRENWERLKEHKSQVTIWINGCQGRLLSLEREADRVLEQSQRWPKTNLVKIGAVPVGIPADQKI